MGRIIEYPKSKFTYNEDELSECECRECGWSTEGEEYLVCPECNSEDIVIYSCHEGCICEGCDHEFDIWEDCYSYVTSNSINTIDIIMICQDCYDELEED